MQRAVLEGGGDYPANEYIIGSGDNSLLCRYQAEKRNLSNTDQLSLEWAGTFKHYQPILDSVDLYLINFFFQIQIN